MPQSPVWTGGKDTGDLKHSLDSQTRRNFKRDPVKTLRWRVIDEETLALA